MSPQFNKTIFGAQFEHCSAYFEVFSNFIHRKINKDADDERNLLFCAVKH